MCSCLLVLVCILAYALLAAQHAIQLRARARACLPRTGATPVRARGTCAKVFLYFRSLFVLSPHYTRGLNGRTRRRASTPAKHCSDCCARCVRHASRVLYSHPSSTSAAPTNPVFFRSLRQGLGLSSSAFHSKQTARLFFYAHCHHMRLTSSPPRSSPGLG